MHAGKCSDINECTVGSDDCSANGYCKITFGSYSCHCNAGFQGDGVVRDDLDEWSNGSNTCGDNSLCLNTFGGYTCDCIDGYSL